MKLNVGDKFKASHKGTEYNCTVTKKMDYFRDGAQEVKFNGASKEGQKWESYAMESSFIKAGDHIILNEER